MPTLFFQYRSRLIIAANTLICLLTAHAALEFKATTLEIKGSPQSKHVTGIFVCKNTGSRPVTISRIRTTCGCTTATPPTTAIQPGSTAEIPVKMDLRITSGRQQKGVVVETKEAPYRYSLTIAAILPEHVKASPKSLLWVSGTPPSPRTITLTRLTPDADVGSPRTADPAFTYTLDKTPTGWKLAVDVLDTKRQRFGSIVIPVTVAGSTHELKVPLSVVAPPPKSKPSFFDRLRGK